MKNKNLIIALTMAIAVGIGATAYASTGATNGTNGNRSSYERTGLGRTTGMRGYDYVESILKNKLGMTDKEITDGLNSGKTMYDLAKEKGMTVDQFKTALLEERNKAVDQAVADGKITKEEGDSIKATLKSNLENCTGVPGERMGNGKRGTGHMMGNGTRGNGNCYINNEQ
ncbi:hypothetical protein I6U48_23680 [Clostridium sp. PL3]|uniref:DUF2680 domain-containing protein n=1 Tax=Clostridium thailandense TaxID=2794346 RepID=A0A949X463_9CLOT|nr:hypothetical protein [Clostridium thailandense]MBV7275899.1 hypothetical protein [Clostridium thailandense]